MKFWWLAILSRIKVHRPRWFVPLVVLIISTLFVAAAIYAFVVFKAVSERSNNPHVHTRRTN